MAVVPGAAGRASEADRVTAALDRAEAASSWQNVRRVVTPTCYRLPSALHSENIDLSALGNRICILGPSNSGKSTLADAIARNPQVPAVT